MRRYDRWEIDAAVLEDQHRRHDAKLAERLADPRWQLVPFDDGLPGLRWQYTTAASVTKEAAS